MEQQVKDIIEKEIRPLLQGHGGDIEFLKLENNKVYVTLQGACSGCPGALMTMKNGVERLIKEQIPEIESVEAVR
ncbi:TPA: hypothetical protein DDW35_11035 [Candidatus Sumerlaeota bacterium]|jgi:Fe-S cluster biogenesis protein NfuA|nr:hypothetical protein [Candidatus Sumerlaeota bacterium]